MLRPGLTGRTRKVPFLRLTLDSSHLNIPVSYPPR
jgi:hypothetical protein